MTSDPWKLLRLAGVLALLVGPFAVRALLPEQEVAWDGVTEMRVSLEDCTERRGERGETVFTLPAESPQPVAWTRVAGWFRMAPEDVCAANGVEAAACSARRLAPGESLVLPLQRHAAGPPGRQSERSESADGDPANGAGEGL